MKIVLWPNPTLTKKSELVTPETWPSEGTLKEMYELMKEKNGVGLAAIQVGIPLRFFITDVGEGMELYVNPAVTPIWASGTSTLREGCLSTPGLFSDVLRWNHVFLSATVPAGQGAHMDLTGLRAQVVQHETEHLDGMLYTDHVSGAERSRIRGEMQRLRKSGKL